MVRFGIWLMRRAILGQTNIYYINFMINDIENKEKMTAGKT